MNEETFIRRTTDNLRSLLAIRSTSISQFDPDYPVKDPEFPGVDCDEVFPNIFVGNIGAAKNSLYLRKVGITHVLNTAEGSRLGCVDTSQEFYKPFGINYKGLQLMDVAHCNIAMYFPECTEFIQNALKSGGKVLVNCLMGISRSSTCVLAYLMMNQNMTAVQALTEVRRQRDVHPNEGFLRQLADLDNLLRRERHRLL